MNEILEGKTVSLFDEDNDVVNPYDLDQVINHQMVSNPKFKTAWEQSQNEYDVIHQFVQIRKCKKITQTQLAEKAGCSQQVISRFENRECQSTFATVCKLVNSLGYKIVLEPK